MKSAAYEQERLLQRIKALIEKDDRMVGLWAVGSMATGKADKYSDLDVYILIGEEHYAQVFSERASFAEKLGKVLSSFEVEWPNCQLYGVILDNFVEVDLCYCKPEQVEIFGQYKIIVDKNGGLQELLTKHTVSFEVDAKKRLSEHMGFAAYNVLHAINMLGRGEYWSSIRQVEMLRKRIVSLIGLRTRTDVDEEYRRLEALISKEVDKSLRGTLCGYDFESIAKAIGAATRLFMREAEELCTMLSLPYSSERFERLLAYLDEICSERDK